MTNKDLQWQAESDAYTMAKYQEIISDKSRMGRAVKFAQKKAKDMAASANAMQKVASRGKKK